MIPVSSPRPMMRQALIGENVRFVVCALGNVRFVVCALSDPRIIASADDAAGFDWGERAVCGVCFGVYGSGFNEPLARIVTSRMRTGDSG